MFGTNKIEKKNRKVIKCRHSRSHSPFLLPCVPPPCIPLSPPPHSHLCILSSYFYKLRLLLETAMEYAKKKILVWWDLNSCQVPTDFKKVSSIAKNIRVALRNANFHGEITVKAYGDEDIIPSEVRQALYFTGISLHLSGVNDSYKSMWMNMRMFPVDNPTPANILYIGRGGYAITTVLNSLADKNFNILLAVPSVADADASFTAAASAIWLLPTLLLGGNPMGQEHVQEQTMEYENKSISVFWNVGICKVPTTDREPVYNIAKKIRCALSNANLHGELFISAYVDKDIISTEVVNELYSSGISIHHKSGVDASDNTIMFDMLSWFGKNRDNPSNILYIGDDGGCISETLNTLAMKQHNILLAVPSQAHADADEYLTAAASTIWLWPTLVSGGSPMYTEQQAHEQVLELMQGGESGI